MLHEALVKRAAEAIRVADALVITAGAGMGVDSGLPDFRGSAGFWRAYPPYKTLGLDFASLANPLWFRRDPALAWGFYGHRLALYRSTAPHEGFAILRRWSERAALGGFVFTSNVDGQFQRAGFDPERVAEVHGAIEWLQCVASCGAGVFPAEAREVAVDPESFRASEPFPRCPRCGALARPNILMFGDADWDDVRWSEQRERLELFLKRARGTRVVAVECGAGQAIPTVRYFSEEVATLPKGSLVRINPREFEVPPGGVGLASGALEALRAIDALV